jgi:hypothetical protein
MTPSSLRRAVPAGPASRAVRAWALSAAARIMTRVLRAARTRTAAADSAVSMLRAGRDWKGMRAAHETTTRSTRPAIVVAARAVMPLMPRIVLMLTDMATMISPASAAPAPAVAVKTPARCWMITGGALRPG